MPDDDPKKKIIDLFNKGTRKNRTSAKPKGGNSVSVSGNGNVVAGGDVHYHAGPKPRPKVTVQTGVGVINAKQKADLTKKLNQWLTARNVVRRDKMTIQAAWSAMNSHVGVNSYHEMTPEDYQAALAWLKRQHAILNSMASAPVKIGSFHNDMIKAIKARSKQLGDLNYYRPYIAVTYGVDSLTKLTDRQLQEVRAWIMRQRR